MLSVLHSSFTQCLESDRTHLEKVSLVPKKLETALTTFLVREAVCITSDFRTGKSRPSSCRMLPIV